MDPKKVEAIKKAIAELVGPTGVYILLLHNGTNTLAWADGDDRVKIRGLLDCGNEYLRGALPLGWNKPADAPPVPPAMALVPPVDPEPEKPKSV